MRKIEAFSLLELLFSLALVSLLCLSCLPAWFSLSKKNELQLIERDLITALRYGRTLAFTQQLQLALTPLPNQQDWSKGMILFVDNKMHSYSSKDQLLYRWQWQVPELTVTWKGFQSNQYLLFASNIKHAASSGHFNIKLGKVLDKKIIVNRLGRINLASFISNKQAVSVNNG